jgi:MFS family permease
LLTAWLIGLVQALIIAAFDSTIPIIAPDYYNFDSMDVGLLFLAFGCPFFFFGPVAGWAVDRFGTKIPTVLGYIYLVPVLLCLRFVRPGSTPQIAVYAVLLSLNGIGVTSVGSPSVVESGAVVENYYKANRQFFGDTGPYAQLYGINSMIVSAGFTFGPLLAGGLKDSIGYGNMNAVLAALCAVTAYLSWLYVGGRRDFNWVKSRHVEE